MSTEAAGKEMRIKILAPNRTVLDKTADFILLHTSEGDMGVLFGHEPYSALMDYGVLRVYSGREQTDEIAVLGGFVMIQDNEVVVLSNLAEQADKLAETVESMKRERAESKRNEQIADVNVHRVEKALRRILVQVDVSSYAITKGREEQPE